MTRFLASLLAAILMSATFAMPAYAGGKPGSIASFTMTPSGSQPNCTYTLVAKFVTPKKDGYLSSAVIWRSTEPGGVAAFSGDRSLAVGTTELTYTLSATSFTTTSYYLVLGVAKPSAKTGGFPYSTVDKVTTEAWTLTGTSCGTTVTYP